MTGYQIIETSGAPVKAWTQGVPVEEAVLRQLENVARLPFIHHYVAAMPDVHWGLGATVGAVIPCRGAVVPAAVGVDIGCGMMAVRTSLTSHRLPESLAPLRASIERAVPHGRTGKGRVAHDRGAWRDPPPEVVHAWKTIAHDGISLERGLQVIVAKHPKLASGTALPQLGTLAPATISSNCALTRATGCGRCCTRARAASATASAPGSSSRRRWSQAPRRRSARP